MWIEPGQLDLTYCTNIHAGESWPEVRASVEQYACSLRKELTPGRRFGIGLRLSGIAAAALLEGSELADFKRFLDENGLYVAVMNGFPFGSFHCGRVKEKVFAPDWRETARVGYTLNLVQILAELLPPGMDGGISTIPLSYKPWLRRNGSEFSAWSQIVANLAMVVEELVRVRRETGKLIHIDIEPEPDGMVETTEELVQFFHGPLRQTGGALLAGLLGVSEREAQQHLRTHLQVCFDTCHLLVEYEDLLDSVDRLQEHGIGIGRLQISSAIQARMGASNLVRAQIRDELLPFAESVYLHQVVEQGYDGEFRHFADLEAAMCAPLRPGACEWRIHYHVPLFTDVYGALMSTQAANREILCAVMASPFTQHIEIETYTWDVLPAALKLDLLPSIAREYRWVLEQLRPMPHVDPVETASERAGMLHA
jgi:sugar phosphate isomerase/epimerase